MTSEKATFAAGCFWGVQRKFDALDGVQETLVGYCGGDTAHPDYHMVCSGTTNHAEAVQITFDPHVISYGQLLAAFWRFHNPTTLNAQGPDRGSQYRSAIFYHSPAQKEKAEDAKVKIASLWPDPIVTEITAMGDFWPAEAYHQKYLDKRDGKA